MSAIRARLAAVLCCALGLVASCDPPPNLCAIDDECDGEYGEFCDPATGECRLPCGAAADCQDQQCCFDGDIPSCKDECGTGGTGGRGGAGGTGGACGDGVPNCAAGESLSGVDCLCRPYCTDVADCYDFDAFCASDSLCYLVDVFAACPRVANLPGPGLDAPLLYDPGQDTIGSGGNFCAKAATCANNGNVCQFSFQFYDPDGDVASSRADLHGQLRFVDADGTLTAPYEVLEPAGNLLFLQGCFDEADSSITGGVVLFDAARHQSNPLCLAGSTP